MAAGSSEGQELVWQGGGRFGAGTERAARFNGPLVCIDYWLRLAFSLCNLFVYVTTQAVYPSHKEEAQTQISRFTQIALNQNRPEKQQKNTGTEDEFMGRVTVITTTGLTLNRAQGPTQNRTNRHTIIKLKHSTAELSLNMTKDTVTPV